jgi:adenylosuccinate synthase
MRARAVIGANFGDEGKGLVVDYLCARQGAGIVVRFNGGAQSGHTVVTPEGKRHVFSHFGAGTFAGVPTFLSQYFVVNPIMFFRELGNLDFMPEVYAHPQCVVSTFADMIINQRKEDKRGVKRHGSCGIGVHETMVRSQVPELTITMQDLWNHTTSLESLLAEICDRYARFRTGSPIDEPDMTAAYLRACWKLAELVRPLGIGQCKDPVFEGAQGLLLDQDNLDYYPHVTHSKTGLHNVRALCAQAGITELEPYYVSRTYLTRHGAGPLPGEDPALAYADLTNLEHPYQGILRFAPLDRELRDRCAADAAGHTWKLVFTHCDQAAPPTTVGALHCHGETRDHMQGEELPMMPMVFRA